MIAQEHNGRSYTVLLCNLINTLVTKQRASGATKWTVRRNVNAFLLAKVYDLLLWAQWVVLDLVDGGDNGSFGEQLLQVLDGVVGDANSLDLFRM